MSLIKFLKKLSISKLNPVSSTEDLDEISSSQSINNAKISENSFIEKIIEFDDNENDPSKSKNIYSINKKPIQPILSKFPKTNGRKYLAKWYTEYKWLEYSVSTDSAYCFSCRHFSPNEFSTLKGFKCWKNAKRFAEHEKSDHHKKSEILLLNRIDSHKQLSIVSKVVIKNGMLSSQYLIYFSST